MIQQKQLNLKAKYNLDPLHAEAKPPKPNHLTANKVTTVLE